MSYEDSLSQIIGRGRADLRDTKRFVLNCPFISAQVRAAALLFLGSRARKVVKNAEGRVPVTQTLAVSVAKRLASATRQQQWLELAVTQVLFFGSLGGGRSYAPTILRVTRGYDVGNERELSQVARKMGVGGGRDVLHAATLLCLSLGPGTCSYPHELAVFNYWSES